MEDLAVRLVVWNANMAFDRKVSVMVERLRPDVAVISECAAVEILHARLGDVSWTSMLWAGRNRHKGVGVFAFGDYQVTAAPSLDVDLEWVVPAAVTGPTEFDLLGVWAMNHRASNPDPTLWPQPAAAIEGRQLRGPTVLAGDFNHSLVWDMPRRPAKNHSRTLLAAQQQALVSAYHDWFDEEQAAESLKTFHRKGKASHRPAHHIDYAFIPAAWTSRLVSVTVGRVADWVDGGLSDHAPLTIEVRDDDPIRP